MLTHKKKVKIAKHLAAILYVFINWTSSDWADIIDCITYHVVEIAYEVGGQRMYSRIPVLMSELERVTHEHID